MCATPNRPSLRVFFTNWRESKLPLHRKLALTFRNNWTKMRTRNDCCGHLGEPGCCEVERPPRENEGSD